MVSNKVDRVSRSRKREKWEETSLERRLGERCTWTREDEFWESTREEPEREGTGATIEKRPRKKKQRRDLNGRRGKLKKLQDWFWMKCLVFRSLHHMSTAETPEKNGDDIQSTCSLVRILAAKNSM